jgi:predicted RNase H-like nuclease
MGENDMSWVAGIDGCRAGWVVVLVEHKAGVVRHHHITLYPSFADVLAIHPKPRVIAIDIPIGLLDRPDPGGRECDRQARKLLSRRASSIFSPPTRPMLEATGYDQVRSQGLSIQSFNVLPKIREVDRLMTPDVQRRVHEAHPELAFAALAGTPMRYNKKTLEGREERRKVFESLFHRRGEKSPFTSLFEKKGKRKAPGDFDKYFPRSRVAPDDILDACALAWTALCISGGQANRVPDRRQIDRKGLRMEICFPSVLVR